MELSEQILQVLQDNLKEQIAIRKLLTENKSKYCYSDEACRIMMITRVQDLKPIRRYMKKWAKRGALFIYDKEECEEICAKLNSGEIQILSSFKRMAS